MLAHAPKLVHVFNICMMHAYGIWIQCRVQQIVCRHCFLTTTGYDNNKGHLLTTTIIFRAASIVFTIHWDKCSVDYDQICMVELKVTLSINLMFVQR